MKRIVLLLVCAFIALAATPSAISESGGAATSGDLQTSASVDNIEPAALVIDTKAIDNDPSMPGTQVTSNVEEPTKIAIQARADDGNGWQDLVSGKIEVTPPGGDELKAVTPTAPKGEGKGRTQEYEATFEIPAGVAPGEYEVKFTAEDRTGKKETIESTFVVAPALAIGLSDRAIKFGDGLGPGTTSHANPVHVGIRNLGNVAMNIHVSASPLRGEKTGATIGPNFVKYSADSKMSGEVSLSSDGYTDTGVAFLPGLPARLVYFDIHMPSGDQQYIPADEYRGTITIGAVSG